MREALSIGLLAAIGAGAAFGAVTAIEGTLAQSIGAVNASLVENIAAGAISALAFAFIISRGSVDWGATRDILPLAGLAGVLVIVAVAGIAYSVPQIGVAAGNVALVFGQVAIAVLVDTVGFGSYGRIPLNPSRIMGLLLLAAGTLLVLPRTN